MSITLFIWKRGEAAVQTDKEKPSNEELAEQLAEMEKQFSKLNEKFDKLVFLRNLIILSIAALFVLVLINRTGHYP